MLDRARRIMPASKQRKGPPMRTDPCRSLAIKIDLGRLRKLINVTNDGRQVDRDTEWITKAKTKHGSV